MDSVLRSAAIYIVVLFVFRVAGRRTLSELTTFDFVLLLVIGEATQQALLGDDFSITNAFIVIVSLVGMDITLTYIKRKSTRIAKLIDGESMIIVEYGKVLDRRIQKSRIDQDDILQAARTTQGLERLDQIKFAILEKDGKISIIPNR
ncbi:YetF domain-containing protein [Stutzerimonas stutzeri]|uniref:DUF421 domain-containing protein n=1 Tax=Stutzerimonas stutzeri TaxID=316 RepID=UPI000C9B4005|nr:YetF domain-containing protein [Stutzerimonas stutzeri]PNG13812.1 hypothetical protein CXK97_11660 [Stutzerimonas stutzeri]